VAAAATRQGRGGGKTTIAPGSRDGGLRSIGRRGIDGGRAAAADGRGIGGLSMGAGAARRRI
jgi:hypothetical protein